MTTLEDRKKILSNISNFFDTHQPSNIANTSSTQLYVSKYTECFNTLTELERKIGSAAFSDLSTSKFKPIDTTLELAQKQLDAYIAKHETPPKNTVSLNTVSISSQNLDEIAKDIAKSLKKSFDNFENEVQKLSENINKTVNANINRINASGSSFKSFEKNTSPSDKGEITDSYKRTLEDDLISNINKLPDVPTFQENSKVPSKISSSLKTIIEVEKNICLNNKKFFTQIVYNSVPQLEKLSKLVSKSQFKYGIFKTFGPLTSITIREASKKEIQKRISSENKIKTNMAKYCEQYDFIKYIITFFNIKDATINTILQKSFKKTFGAIFTNIDLVKETISYDKNNPEKIGESFNNFKSTLFKFKNYHIYFQECVKYMPNYTSILNVKEFSATAYKNCKNLLTDSKQMTNDIKELIDTSKKELNSFNKFKKLTTNYNEINKALKEIEENHCNLTIKNSSLAYILKSYSPSIKYRYFGKIIEQNVSIIKSWFLSAILSLDPFLNNSSIDKDVIKKLFDDATSAMNITIKNCDNIRDHESFPPFAPKDPNKYSKTALKKFTFVEKPTFSVVPDVLKIYISENSEVSNTEAKIFTISEKFLENSENLKKAKKNLKKLKISSKIFNTDNLAMLGKVCLLLLGILSVLL